MSVIPRSHPRYHSLMVRAHLAEEMNRGIVVPEGLIAHGRGEAFDYLLGESTQPFGARAEEAAAAQLLLSRHPVVSVNGNVAALASREVAQLAQEIPQLQVEVNLFHRTPRRAELIAEGLTRAGVKEVLGVHPTARLRGLPSDRGWVDERGILPADTVLVPLEDGDRAEALRKSGKFVISIDLNPLSRSTLAANLPIIDELTRALPHIAIEAHRMKSRSSSWAKIVSAVEAEGLREEALHHLAKRLRTLADRSS